MIDKRSIYCNFCLIKNTITTMACCQSRIILFEESTKSRIVNSIKKSYINAETEYLLVTSWQYAMRSTDQRKDVDDHQAKTRFKF